MAQSGEELLPETQPVKVSSLHLQGDENVVEPNVQEPEKEDESKRKLGKALEDESMAQHETQPLKASPLHLQSDENVAEEPEKEDESMEDESMAQHETQPLKASPLHLQSDENVAEKPEKEDESKIKLGKALEDESMAQHETQPLKASPLHLQSDENVAEKPEKEDESKIKLGKALEDESMAQHETQPLKASPLHLQSDENVAEKPEKEDENSKGVVQNVEEKVGVNAVDNAKLPEDDEVVDQFAQEENENGALENDAMAEYELNKEEIAAAEASSSDSNKGQPKEFFLVLTDSGKAVLGIKGENGKFIASEKNCEVLKEGRQGNTEGTTRIFLRPKIPPDSDKNEREEESDKNEREEESDKNEREEESEEEKKKKSLLQWLEIHKDSDINDVTTKFFTDLKTRACCIGTELSFEFVKCFVILSSWEPVAKTLKRYENQTPPSLVTSSLLTSFNMAADHLKVSRKEGGRGIENLFNQLEEFLQLFQQALDCLEDALCGSHILETEEDLSSLTVKESLDSADKILVGLKSISRSKMSMFNGILDEQLKKNIGEVWNQLEKENGGSSFMASLLKRAKYFRDKQVEFEESHPKITRYGKYFVETAFGFPASLLLDYPKAYGIVDDLKQFTKAPRSEKKKWAREKVFDTVAWTGLCYVGKKLKGPVPSGIDFLQVIWEQVPSTVPRTQTPVKQEQEDFSGYWVASIDEDDDTVIIDLFEEEVSHGGEKIEDLEDLVHLEQEEEGEETFNDDAQV